MEPIKIMMVGGRRCGKTSVLAAMQNCFECVMADSEVNIGINDFNTMDVLEEKFREAEDYFRERSQKKRTFVPDSNPSQDISTYSFNIGTRGRNSDIILNFIDYPGEFISDPQQREKILSHISESRILVVAIDTPHMMEEDQKFDDRRNLEKRVTEMIKKSGFADEKYGPGLVLFVPLKSERYKNDGRMGEVSAQIKQSYASLINYLQTSNKRITIAITPIFTFGGAAFSRFERDENGEIRIDPQFKCPEKAIYNFPDPSKTRPEPQYCEQPLLFILSFVITQASYMKANRGWFDNIWEGFKEWYKNFPTLDEYIKQLRIINGKLKTDVDGFYLFK